jgi:2-methylisocitrate lyase-like PEP mutase family enzyme
LSTSHERFRELHRDGFVMPNAWDGLSAAAVRDAGFPATATSSAALAFSLGRLDGRHQVSRAEHLAHARMLETASGLPVNGDFEDGYGETPEAVAGTVEAAIAAGLAGIGIEDTTGDPAAPIRDFDDAVRIVLTGRTDNFINGRPDLEDTIRRLVAFAEAGADVLYAPGLPDMDSIRAVVAAVAPRPVNVLNGPGDGRVPVQTLLAAGVRRISLGSGLYLHTMGAAAHALRELAAGDLAVTARGSLSFADVSGLLGG